MIVWSLDTVVKQMLGESVITGQSVKLSAVQKISSRIANVGNNKTISVSNRYRHCGRHPSEIRVGGSLFQQRRIHTPESISHAPHHGVFFLWGPSKLPVWSVAGQGS